MSYKSYLSYIVLLVATAAQATIFPPTSDSQLIARSDAVTIATVQSANSRLRDDGVIVTDYRLAVEQALKGAPGGELTVEEIGGVAGGRVQFIADSAVYAPGERVMAFLRRRTDGTYFTTSMTLGKFEFARSAAGLPVVVRSGSELAPEPARDAAAFAQFVREGGAGAYFTDSLPLAQQSLKPATNTAASAYTLAFNGSPVRRNCPSACTMTFKLSSADTTGGVGRGLNAWTNDPGAFITLSNGGTTTSTSPAPDTNNVIYLNYTGTFDPSICDNSQACTILSGDTSTTHTYAGETFISILDADILIQPGLTGTAFDGIITHELGHAIGLRHSNAGVPSSSNAIMTFPFSSTLGANLQQWDRAAVDTVYGSGATCQQPAITSISNGGQVPAGTSVTLTVTATGTAPLSYQWYDGMSGDTSLPVGTNSANFSTGPINTTRNFWVKVSNACPGSANSTTVTLTPQPPCTTKPTILVNPQSQTVASGSSASLSVGHSGTPPFGYQWYIGASGDTSNPAPNGNAQSFTTPPLTQTTLFWVRVSNDCGFANSDAATITVSGPCIKPVFTLQPSDLFTVPGYLAATATDATSYQWFLGLSGDESHPQAGLTPSNSRFVTQLYLDVLHRAADAPSAAFGAALDAHTLSRQSVAQLVLTSTEARGIALTDWFRRDLHRNPSPSEIAFWMPAFVAGATDEEVHAQILGSAESFALAGGTNAAWIAKLFNDVLHRAPTAPEQASFLAFLGSHTRAATAQSILQSAEGRTVAVNDWFSVLRRTPASSESTGLVALLFSGLTDEEVRAMILATNEYFNFGSILPIATEGGNYWVKANKDCGGTNSRTAGVAMNDICSKPSIVSLSPGGAINVGGAPNLIVTVDSSRPVAYQWYIGPSGNTANPIFGANGAVLLQPIDAAGAISFWVRVTNACGSTDSPAVTVNVVCGGGPAIGVSAPPTVPAGTPFIVSVDTRNNAFSKFELQTASDAAFTAGVQTFTSTNGIFSLPAVQAPPGVAATRQFFRARGFLGCGGDPTAYSPTASTLVTTPPPANSPSFGLATPPCASADCTLRQTIFIAGVPKSAKQALDVTDTFSATVDKPWMSVSPSSGPLPAEGVSVTLSIDTSALPIGSTEGSVTVVKTTSSGKVGILGATSSTTPVSISLVSPVTPKPKDPNAPLNTLLIPAIAHADGIGALFQSDVRLTNTASQSITYQLTYTPSGTDGTQSGKSTTISVNPGETKALNDVVKNFFGAGAVGEGGIGTLEIRPTNFSGKDGGVNVSYASVAASRTYSTTSTGTFGQFIPAVALANFLSKSDVSKISLQQVAESAAYRTNIGFVEGSGQNVDLLVSLFDDANVPVAQRTFSLRPYEHSQQRMSSFFGIGGIDDGRVEVKVTSDGGKVTAYASTIDNTTSDPLLVFPVDPSKLGASRFTIPGVAELNNGAANFHTDMRVFNGGSTPVDVTLAYVPSTGAPPAPVQITLQPGEVKAYDNTLLTLWNITGSGGAVVATTDHDAPLVLTARTYSRRDDGGTLGQFIPGVAAGGGIGLDDKPLQIVQLEQSPSYRTNVGFVELTGNPVTIEVTGVAPDSKVAAKLTRDLGPGEFVQLGSLFAQMGFGNVYNGRVSVKVIAGDGRVTAYGSNIDNRTQDPTFIPAQ